MHCMFLYDLRQYIYIYIYHVLTEALYEKKQSILTYDAEFAKLQAQAEKLESTSAGKDPCIGEYETIVKGSEGEVIQYSNPCQE